MNKPVATITEDAALNSRIVENRQTSYGNGNQTQVYTTETVLPHQKQFSPQHFPAFPSAPNIAGVDGDHTSANATSSATRPDGLVASLAWRLRMAMRPGISVKERIRQLPLIGYTVAWVNALIQLPLTRHHHTIELAQLRQELSALRTQLTQVNHRVALVEPFVVQVSHLLNADLSQLEQRVQLIENLKAGTRLHQIDMLDVGARLMKLEQQETARKIKQFTELMRHAQRDAIANADQLAQLSSRLEKIVSGSPDLANSVAVPIAAVIPPSNPSSKIVDDFFFEFEEAFRGDRSEIKKRLRAYLPYLQSSPSLQAATWVDVGCGRGEWLELLNEEGFTTLGIDLNAAKVDTCIQLGFAAKVADAIEFLESQPAGSLAGVTGFHIIEHLPFEKLLALFDAALHALIPGGMIIFETPNPENVLVGSCNFYFDPTHVHPIVPDVAQFMAMQRGFSHAEILRLHPYPNDHLVDASSNVGSTLNRYLFGPQDFALIARK